MKSFQLACFFIKSSEGKCLNWVVSFSKDSNFRTTSTLGGGKNRAMFDTARIISVAGHDHDRGCAFDNQIGASIKICMGFMSAYLKKKGIRQIEVS